MTGEIRDFKIEKLLGEGGMGSVYLAEDMLLGRKIALKMLHSGLTRDPQFTDRFKREARVQSSLIHTNIVTLYSFFNEGGHYYMAMEYAEGETLKQVIERTGPIPEERALRLFRQVLEAVTYAHSKGIIHRDIKPGNIMVGPGDSVKVMDFGIAKILGDKGMTRTGAKMGTIYYMSPEQIMAAKDIDHRTDIYSLGITLYETLTGQLPFRTDTESEFAVMKEIVEKEIRDPRDTYLHITQATVDLIRGMTAKEREQRTLAMPAPGVMIARDREQRGVDVNRTSGKKKSLTPQAMERGTRDVGTSRKLASEELAGQLLLVKTRSDQGSPIPPLLPLIPIPVAKARKSRVLRISLGLIVSLCLVALVALMVKNEKGEGSAGVRKMVFVEGGRFEMGSNVGDRDEKPVHSVYVSSFYMDEYEVTQAEYERVMGKNPSYFKCPTCPVENVSWDDAVEYARRVGKRLPTEAEWEYAARGGNKSRGYKNSGSNSIGDVAWYYGNSGSKTHPVGEKQPNELGLYDMSGNVWEWCADWYDENYYSKSPERDPKGPSSGQYRVLRGGSWYNVDFSCRVADRGRYTPTYRSNYFGFRCVQDGK